MSRGYIFSIDAALAAIVVTLVLWSTVWEMDLPRALPEVQIERLASDALDVRIADGTLASMDRALIESGFRELLPSNRKFRLQIMSYSYSGGFVQTGSVVAGEDIGVMEDPETEAALPYRTTRNFLTFSGDSIDRYYRVTLWVWLD